MPTKHKFIVKTVAAGSDNVTISTSILDELANLRKGALATGDGEYAMFEILVKKEKGVITVNSLDTEGKLTTEQQASAKVLHEQSVKTINALSDDGGKIRLKFTVDTRK